MDKTIKTPGDLSADWRFAAREPAKARRLMVHPDGMDTVLLVKDEEGAWWAVPGTCRACGDSLEPKADRVLQPADRIECATCGAAHGPGVAGCEQVPTLVVDDEIFLLAAS